MLEADGPTRTATAPVDVAPPLEENGMENEVLPSVAAEAAVIV